MGKYGRYKSVLPTLTNDKTLDFELLDANGRQLVSGGAPASSAADEIGNPFVVAGLDGVADATRVISVDSSGRQVVVGPAADGAAVLGAPVRVAGKDGSGNTQDILTTTAGVQIVEPQGTGINVAATAAPFVGLAADQPAAVAAAAGLRIVGYMLAEQAAAAAEFRIMHGATVGGATNLYTVKLASGESTSEWMGEAGIACPNGLTIDRVSGTADVTLFHKTVA